MYLCLGHIKYSNIDSIPLRDRIWNPRPRVLLRLSLLPARHLLRFWPDIRNTCQTGQQNVFPECLGRAVGW